MNKANDALWVLYFYCVLQFLISLCGQKLAAFCHRIPSCHISKIASRAGFNSGPIIFSSCSQTFEAKNSKELSTVDKEQRQLLHSFTPIVGSHAGYCFDIRCLEDATESRSWCWFFSQTLNCRRVYFVLQHCKISHKHAVTLDKEPQENAESVRPLWGSWCQQKFPAQQEHPQVVAQKLVTVRKL